MTLWSWWQHYKHCLGYYYYYYYYYRSNHFCIILGFSFTFVFFQDVKKQSRVKRKELNKLLGYTVSHLKDKVLSLLMCDLHVSLASDDNVTIRPGFSSIVLCFMDVRVLDSTVFWIWYFLIFKSSCMFTLSVLDIFWTNGGHRIKFVNIIAGCGETVINSTLRLLCRHHGFTSEIYGHLRQWADAVQQHPKCQCSHHF